MRKRSVRLALSSLIALGLVSLATNVFADARTEARRHFRAGMEMISNGQYEQGIAELKTANEILPHPNVIYNIARAYIESGNLEQAIKYYQLYIDMDPPDKDEAQAILEQLKARLERQRAVLAASQQTQQPATTPETTPAAGPKPGTTTPGETGPTTPSKPTTTPSGQPTQPTAAGPTPGAKPGAGKNLLPALHVGAARTQDVYEETVVTASRGAQSPLDAPNSTTIITQQDIELSGATRIEDVLRRVAGIDFMSITGAETFLSMRGFNSRLSNKLMVLIDGRLAWLEATGAPVFRSIPIDLTQVERIEVVRGPASALYGADAFGGVVNIITKAPGKGGAGVKVGAGDHYSQYAVAWASGHKGNSAYRLSAGWNQYSRWSRQVSPTRIDLDVPYDDQEYASRTMFFELAGSRRFGKNTILKFGGATSKADADHFGIGPFYEMQFSGMRWLSDYLQLNTKHFNFRIYHLGNYMGNTGFSVNSAYRGQPTFSGGYGVDTVDVEPEFVSTLKTGSLLHDIHVGAGYRYKRIDWYFLDNTHNEHHFAMYLQDTISVGKHWRFVASGRADYVPYLKRIVASPRGSIIFKPNDRSAFRGSYATSFRTPTFLEAYLDLPMVTPVQGVQLDSKGVHPDDPNFRLDPERIQSFELGYLNQMNDYFDWELSAYYNRVDKLIALRDIYQPTLSNLAAGSLELDPRTGHFPGGFAGFENQCAVYHVFGGEAGVRTYPVEGLDVFANYAYNHTNTSLSGGCNIPSDKRTSAHKVNVGVQVRTKFGLNGEVLVDYVSAQTWAEQVAKVENGTGSLVYQTYDIPAYTLLNAKIGYKFMKNKAEISGTVFNALNDVHQEHPAGQYVARRFMAFGTYKF